MDGSEIKEQDRYLPVANISRIMKKVLPPNAKVSKEAKECIQECVSEFISFVTSEASDRCKTEKRKTINGDDLLWAMGTLGFDKYVDPLKLFLQKYRDSVRGDRPPLKRARIEESTLAHTHVDYTDQMHIRTRQQQAQQAMVAAHHAHQHAASMPRPLMSGGSLPQGSHYASMAAAYAPQYGTAMGTSGQSSSLYPQQQQQMQMMQAHALAQAQAAAFAQQQTPQQQQQTQQQFQQYQQQYQQYQQMQAAQAAAMAAQQQQQQQSQPPQQQQQQQQPASSTPTVTVTPVSTSTAADTITSTTATAATNQRLIPQVISSISTVPAAQTAVAPLPQQSQTPQQPASSASTEK
eukprot:TRINITY_DN345_c0_g1_i1.p1 TRINITY_DN345_c0_g1~~TRINITY_DN345_c0_g1_i1.p1  ORF type:complete len:350 (-),score=129.49 TRINITY_DN345_c0_g1_i1:301-1350(-)